MALGGGGLRTRLVGVSMLIATMVSAVIVAVLQIYLAGLSAADSAHVARARADAAAATIRVVHGKLRILEAGADSLDRDLWVFDEAGNLAEGVLPTPGADVVRDLGASGESRRRTGGGLMLVSRPVEVNGVRVVVVAGVDLTPYESSERRTLVLSVALGALVVVAAGIAADGAARVSLGRVRSMVRRAQEWEEHDLGNRFAMGSGKDEISELGQTLDHLLDRIAAALRSERRLSDEFAHELRTPLSVIRAEAELLLSGGALHPEALRTIVHEAERTDSVIQTMLDAARSRHDEDQTCDVREVLRYLKLPTQTPNERVEVSRPPEGPPVPANAPGSVVAAAVGPVVDNALRFARSGVDLEVRREDATIVVTVLDDGPGFDAEAVAEACRPGFRAGDGGSGAGLGLAVATRLARSVGGDVRPCLGPRGRVELRFPAAG